MNKSYQELFANVPHAFENLERRTLEVIWDAGALATPKSQTF